MTKQVGTFLDIASIDFLQYDLYLAKLLRRLNLLSKLAELHRSIVLPAVPLSDEQVDLADWFYPTTCSWVSGDWPGYDGMDLPESVMTRIEQLQFGLGHAKHTAQPVSLRKR